jgi:hypothetical protein
MLLTIIQRESNSLKDWHLWAVALCSLSLPLLLVAAAVVLREPNGFQELEDDKLAKYCGVAGIAASYMGLFFILMSYDYISVPFLIASSLLGVKILWPLRRPKVQ